MIKNNKIKMISSIAEKLIAVIFPTILICLMVISCDTVEENPDYTYSIEDVWWSDSIDGNGDGFAHYKRLNFNVHLAENVSQRISPRIYYKIHSASTFSFYAFADDYQVTGNNQDNNIFVSVGPPNKELSRGHYDFSIEIYEEGNDRLEVKSDSTFDSILMNNPFEDPAADKVYSVEAWWSGSYDRNSNGYWRHAKLNFDIDVEEEITKTVDAEILYRESETEVYKLYHSFNDISITGTSKDDSLNYIIGLPNKELSFGTYDFRINVYESGSSVLAAFIDEDYEELNDVKFETEEDDSYFYSIENAWWNDETDNDGDQYTSRRRLNFDVDVDKNETREIYAKIYFRHPDSTDYSFYDSTAIFSIHGIDTSDFNNMYIAELDSSQYDFFITVLENEPYDSTRFVEASYSGLNNSELADQKFEKSIQDIKSSSFRRKGNRFK